MMNTFGTYIRDLREVLRKDDKSFSVRKVAARIDIQPSYLSRIERGLEAPPSESTIVLLADVLSEDPDILLALAGKVSTDLQKVIRARPRLFADLIRELKDMPDNAVIRIAREVRDGKW